MPRTSSGVRRNSSQETVSMELASRILEKTGGGAPLLIIRTLDLLGSAPRPSWIISWRADSWVAS